MEIKDIDFREEYYNNVHNMKPNWWMRWGISSVFIVLIIILTLSYVVKYPDVIVSELRLTTNKPSVTLPLSKGSQIDKLLINNATFVNSGSHILILKNNSNYDDVVFLKKKIEQFVFQKDSIIRFFERSINYDLQLGDIVENDWISLSAELLEFYKIEKLGSFKSQTDFLRNELSKQHQLKKQYSQLSNTDEQQKLLLNKKIKTDSILFLKGVISKMDYNNQRRDYYSNSKILQQNDLTIKRINLDIVRIENAIEKFDNNEGEELLKQNLGIKKYLNRVKSSIDSWERKYTLTSPIDGKVSFIQDLKKDVFYEGNAVVITPIDKSFYATIQIPFIGAGKVEEHQRVIIKLNDYPYREYGVLEGVLKGFSPVAGENYYLGKVEIDQKSISTYGKKIKIKENMSGTGEIITKDRSILGRIFEKIIYVFRK